MRQHKITCQERDRFVVDIAELFLCAAQDDRAALRGAEDSLFSTLRSHSRLHSHSNSCMSHTKRFGRSSRRSRRSGRGISIRFTCPRRRTASRCAASRAPTAQHSVFCTTFLQMHAVITQMLICAQTAAAAVLHRWPSLSSRHRRASLAFCLNLCPLQVRLARAGRYHRRLGPEGQGAQELPLRDRAGAHHFNIANCHLSCNHPQKPFGRIILRTVLKVFNWRIYCKPDLCQS